MKTNPYHRAAVDYNRNNAPRAHSAPVKGPHARETITPAALPWPVLMALFLKTQETPLKSLSGRATDACLVETPK